MGSEPVLVDKDGGWSDSRPLDRSFTSLRLDFQKEMNFIKKGVEFGCRH